MSRTEYAGAGGLAPLRRLAEATGHDLEYVVRLANRGELRRLFPNGKTVRISTPRESDKSDMASPQAARLRLLMKRRPPT
jgi:hypothetical protein